MSDLSSVLKDISKKYGSGVAKFGADDLTVDGILSLGSPLIIVYMVEYQREELLNLVGQKAQVKQVQPFL